MEQSRSRVMAGVAAAALLGCGLYQVAGGPTPQRESEEQARSTAALMMALVRRGEADVVTARAELARRPDDWRANFRLGRRLQLLRQAEHRLAAELGAQVYEQTMQVSERELRTLAGEALRLAETPREQEASELLERHTRFM